MKSDTLRIYFLSDILVCCHQEMLLPWQRDVTTSPLYYIQLVGNLLSGQTHENWPKTGLVKIAVLHKATIKWPMAKGLLRKYNLIL